MRFVIAPLRFIVFCSSRARSSSQGKAGLGSAAVYTLRQERAYGDSRLVIRPG
ncbi:MAG: hypothetical protein LC744_00475 [Chloroflexi bacterium]|nr:hypothetical protein [Chloroflexota bacterium]